MNEIAVHYLGFKPVVYVSSPEKFKRIFYHEKIGEPIAQLKDRVQKSIYIDFKDFDLTAVEFLKIEKLALDRFPKPTFSSYAHQIPGIRNIVKHPLKNEFGDYYSIIIDLNDHYLWTREQIADWLDAQDNAPVFGEKKC